MNDDNLPEPGSVKITLSVFDHNGEGSNEVIVIDTALYGEPWRAVYHTARDLAERAAGLHHHTSTGCQVPHEVHSSDPTIPCDDGTVLVYSGGRVRREAP